MAKARKGFSRADRIAEQIQRELAELVRTGLKDRAWAGSPLPPYK